MGVLTPSQIVELSSSVAMLVSAGIHVWATLRGRAGRPVSRAPQPNAPVDRQDLDGMRALLARRMQARLSRGG